MTASERSVSVGGRAGAGVPGSVPPCWPVTVVDACAYGRWGLQWMLTHPEPGQPGGEVETHDGVEAALTAARKRRVRLEPAVQDAGCMVLRLSSCPALALQQLLVLDGTVLAQVGYRRLIVLSPFAKIEGIRQVLVSGDLCLPVRIVSARRPVAWLRRVVLSQVGHDERLPRVPIRVLTPPERRALSGTLQEMPVYQQARRQGLSTKTVYAHRRHALQKLHSPGLTALLLRLVSQ